MVALILGPTHAAVRVESDCQSFSKEIRAVQGGCQKVPSNIDNLSDDTPCPSSLPRSSTIPVTRDIGYRSSDDKPAGMTYAQHGIMHSGSCVTVCR